MTTLPENDLETALAAVNAEGIPTDLVLKLLAESELLVPVGGDPKAGDVSFPVFEYGGRRYVGVFSSATQARGLPHHSGGFLKMTGADLVALWPDDVDMVVNPGGDFGTVLSEDDVRRRIGA